MENSIAQLDGVRLIYHEPHAETLALEGISFEVERGKFTALVGPSGCGKTSLLSILAGITNPSGGSVTVLGKPLTGEAAGRIRNGRRGDRAKNYRTSTGYMLQRDNLLDWRTIEENVLLGLEIRHMLTAETRAYARELLTRYGLSDFMTLYPRQLSGGMRQKVALIRTLVLRPELLLLDEPFSALDFQTRLLLANEVSAIIKREGCTAVLVTHDISEAISMCDRVIVLTSRPASIRRDINITLHGDTPLIRRSDPAFKDYFNIVWEEMMRNEEFN